MHRARSLTTTERGVGSLGVGRAADPTTDATDDRPCDRATTATIPLDTDGLDRARRHDGNLEARESKQL